jgi:hypothetical protein
VVESEHATGSRAPLPPDEAGDDDGVVETQASSCHLLHRRRAIGRDQGKKKLGSEEI